MRNLARWSPAMIATLVLVVSTVLLAQSSPLAGTWQLNATKSKYSPGPPPKSQTLTWERVPGGLKFSVDTINAQGQTIHTENLEKDDGSEAPVQGAQNPTTRYLRRIDDRTYEDGDRVNGKATITRRIVLSPDGRTLTVTMKGTNANGQAVNNVVVYER
jgi:hypothetical protein